MSQESSTVDEACEENGTEGSERDNEAGIGDQNTEGGVTEEDMGPPEMTPEEKQVRD